MSQIRAEDALLFVTDGRTPLEPQNLFKVVLMIAVSRNDVKCVLTVRTWELDPRG
jgi:hypothetical protein